MPAATTPYVVEGGDGATLHLVTPDGTRRSVVDGMASWWAVIHGYRNPTLDAAIVQQTARFSHVMFGGLTHEPAVRLCARLVEMVGGGLEHVFLADSGSVSVEVAMKMALQYQRGVGRPHRTRFLTWRGGYHGDTFLAMSVCDPDGGMHAMWRDVLPTQIFASTPPMGIATDVAADYVDELRALAHQHRDAIAGVIVEPLVQGAGGMRFYNPAYLRALREICDDIGALMILDEIATGFGRTGRLFASEWAETDPDILCLGKALTGGYASLAATLCSGAVAGGISHSESGVLAHGPTFMASPLAAAVANASLDLLDEGSWRGHVARIELEFTHGLDAARTMPRVVDVRVCGAIGVVELDHNVDVAAATVRAIRAGAWIRPFRNLIYAMPPFVISSEETRVLTNAMIAAAAL